MRFLSLAALTALAGTADEEAQYALRESGAPRCADFTGGDCGFALFIVVVAALVILVLYLSKEGKI